MVGPVLALPGGKVLAWEALAAQAPSPTCDLVAAQKLVVGVFSSARRTLWEVPKQGGAVWLCSSPLKTYFSTFAITGRVLGGLPRVSRGGTCRIGKHFSSLARHRFTVSSTHEEVDKGFG